MAACRALVSLVLPSPLAPNLLTFRHTDSYNVFITNFSDTSLDLTMNSYSVSGFKLNTDISIFICLMAYNEIIPNSF